MALSGTQYDFVKAVIQDQSKLQATLAVAYSGRSEAERVQDLVDLADTWPDFDELLSYDAAQLLQGPFATAQGSATQDLLQQLAAEPAKWGAFAQQVQDSDAAGHTQAQYLAALTAIAQQWVPSITADDIEWLASLVIDTSDGDRPVMLIGLAWIT